MERWRAVPALRSGLRARMTRHAGVLLAVWTALFVATAASEAQTARSVGQLTTFGSQLANAVAVTTDGSENVYVVTSAGVVYEESYAATSAAGTYTQSNGSILTTQASSATSIAVDSAGANLYIGTSSGTVEHWALSNGFGSYQNTFMASTTANFQTNPQVTVDPSGNVWIVDGSGNLYEETGSGTTWTQTTTALTVTTNRVTTSVPASLIDSDASGNLFVATAATAFYKLTVTNGTVGSPTKLTTGITGTLASIAVDANDDLYASTTTGTYVQEAVLSGTTYTETPFYQYVTSAVTIDSQGNAYLVSASRGFVTKLTTAGGYLNFGSVYPASPGYLTAAFTWTSSTSGTLGTPTAVTQGLSNYDFTLPTNSTNTCTSGTKMTLGTSCIVQVEFNPQSSGSRLGAVDLLLSSGTKAARGLTGGVGYTPLAVYQAATLVQTIACPSGSTDPNGNPVTCSTSLSQGRGLSLDPAGNLYVADQTVPQVVVYTYNKTSKTYASTPLVIVSKNTTAANWGSCSPSATALDGEGNLFIACNSLVNSTAYMYEVAGAVGLVTTSTSSLPATPTYFSIGSSSADDHLSADAAGNLYTTTYRPSSNSFLEIDGGTHAATVIATAPSNARFVGAVTDASGNTFAPDYNNSILYELPAGTSQLTTLYTDSAKTTMPYPHAIAQDAAGDLYVTTTNGNVGQGNASLLEFTAGNYSAAPLQINVLGSDSVAVSPEGQIFTVYNNYTIYEYTRGLYQLTFPNTTVGTTSAAQTVVLENAGSAPLTITPPSSGTNPSLSTNFIFDKSSTCPDLTSTSSAFTLGIGQTCTDVVEFQPQVAGSITGQLITTDNSANVAGSTQIINITGTSTEATPTVTVANQTGTLGQSVSLSATVSGAGTRPTGVVTFQVGSGPSVTATCSAGASSGTETCTYANYPTSSGLVGGANTITASFPDDGNYVSTTGTGTLTLAAAPTSTAVTASPSTSTYTTSVTLTATVKSSYGTPTGSVTFTGGGLNQTVALTASGTTGTATASLTTSTLPGGTDTITATFGATTTFATSSGTATETVNKATPGITVASASGTLGQSASLSATITGVTNGVAPTGAVTFVVGSGPSMAGTCTASGNVETCTATYPTTSGLQAGSNTITVTSATDGNYAQVTGSNTLTLQQVPTSTTVSASPNSSTYGSSVTLSATVASTGTTSYGTPGGTVTFKSGSTTLGTGTLSNGVATLATSALVAGSDSITATYTATGNFAGSIGSATEAVSQATPTVTVASATGSLGSTVNLSATVTGVTNGGVPTGAVSFQVGSGPKVTATCTPVNGSSTAETCTYTGYPTSSGLATGANAITATLAADTNYQTASATNTLTLQPAATTISVSTSPNPSTYGGSVTVTATVTSSYGTPTGSVTFTGGGLNNTVALTASGTTGTATATLTTTALPGGSDTITAALGANGNYAASSGTATQVVNKAAPAVAVTNTSGTLGQSATLTATVTGVTNGVAPTGSLTFKVGTGSTVTATCTASGNVDTCTATYPTTSGVVAGNNTITATYAADGNYSTQSGTGTLTETAGTTTNVTASPASYTYGGGNLTLTATVSSNGYGTPSGTVTFTDGTTTLGSAQLSNGTASITTSSLLGGAHAITASYGGVANTYAASSGNLAETVATATPTITVTSPSGTLGQAATVSATVTGATGGAAPTGGVNFVVGSGQTVAGTCSATGNAETCTATYPTTSGVAPGANTITATFAGDSNYSTANVKGTLTETANTTTTVTASPATYAYGGGKLTITATVASSYGTPTGSVTFMDGSTTLGSVALTNGTATYASSTLTGGTHNITVNYGGVTNTFAASTGTLTETVSTATPTVSVSNATGSLGQNASLSATITGVTGGVAPTGTVTFTVGSGAAVTATCTANGSNAETCTASYPTNTGVSTGANAITVNYAGDGNYASANGTGTLNASAAVTTTAVSTSPNPSTYAGSVTVTATVNSNYGTPTGSVTFTGGGLNNTVALTPSGTTGTATATLTTTALPGGSDTITATDAANGNYAASSGTTTQTVNKATPGVSVTSISGTLGQSATLTATVTGVTNGVAPTGTLTFKVGTGSALTATCTANGNVDTCTATYPTTSGVVAGNNTITATYAADGNYSTQSGTGTLTETAGTTTNVTASPASYTYGGGNLTLTATVSSNGYGTPSGTVTFTDGSTTLGSAQLSNGTASITTSTLVGGAHTITASYGGVTNTYAASSGMLNETVATATPTMTVTSAAGTLGQPATLSATVTGITGGVAPTGGVTFVVGSGQTVAGTCSSSGNAETCTATYPTTSGVTPGANTITATFAGDSNYAGSNAKGTLTETANTTTTVTANPATYAYGGGKLTLTATVSSNFGTPTGSVTFMDGSTTLGSVALTNGTATFASSTLTGGTHTITVNYGGVTNSFAASTGTLNETVNTAAPTVSVSNATGTLGQNASLSATITGVTGGVVPTGTVTFTVGTGAAVTATCTASGNVETCTASYPTNSGLAPGANTITLNYAGDGNYAAGSGTGTLNASAAVTTTAVTSSANPSTYGGGVTFTATVSSNYGTPTGMVTFTDGTTTLGSAQLGSNGTASISTAALTGGPHTITATYAGAGSFAGSSKSLTQTVNLLTLTGDSATGTGTYGVATTPVTVTIPYSAAAAPTGAITIKDGYNESLTVQANTCTIGSGAVTCNISFPTSKEPVTASGGSGNALTITQAADGNYAGTSGTGSITINPTPGSTAATAAGSGTWGAATTSVLVKIPYSGAATPTGAVTVTDGYNESVTVAASSCSAANGVLSCTVALPTVNEPVSTGNPVQVSEAADGNYGASSGSGTVAINKIAASTGDSASGSGTYGAATTPVTVQIPYSGPTAPTGAVTVSDTYKDTVTVQASACSASNGVLSCTVAFPTANEPVMPTSGSGNGNSLTVSQAADNNYDGSTGAGYVTIAKAPVTTGDSANGNGTVGVATTSVAVTIPYGGQAAPTGSITVTDSVGETVTFAASTCTVANNALNCTANLQTAKEPVGTTNLTVTQAGDGNYAGSNGTGTLNIGKIASTNGDTVSGTGVYASLVTPITVTIPYAGPTAPTGQITVADSFNESISIQASSCSVVTAGGGTALSCPGSLPTIYEPVGSNPVTVNQAGDTNYSGSIGSGTITITKAPISNNDSATGSGVYGTASTRVTVTIPFGGATAPVGAVTVTDTYGNTVTTPSSVCQFNIGVVRCTVTLPTMSEPVGKNTVSVSQAADDNYQGTAGSGTVTISSANGTNNDSASGSGIYGAATTPIKVQIPYVGNTAPTGAITVTDTHSNTVTIQASSCSANNGVLSCAGVLPTANEPVGGNSVAVSQAADNNYGSSTGNGTISIGKAALTATDTASGKGTYGAPTSPVTVTIPFSGTAAPTGAVTVSDTHGNTVTVAESTCTVSGNTVSCTANLPTANEPLGSNPLTVTQAEDGNYSGSTGTGSVAIGKAVATSTDTATGSGIYGSPTTAVTVTIPYAGSVAPSGAVTVTDGYSNTVTVPASSCTASGGALTCTANLPTANEPVGSNPVTVSQAEDANYSGSTGAGTVTINPAGSSNGDTATGSGTYGAPASSITVVIPYAGNTAPTGAISVADTLGNAVTIAASKCNVSSGSLVCAASLATANEPVGSNALTVAQMADPNHGASSGAGSLMINPAAATTTDTATGTGTYGAPSTPVTVTIPYAGAVAPTGTVTVTDALGNTASVAGTACTAANQQLSCTLSLPTANELLGSNQVTITQAADSNYTGSTGTGTITIGISTTSPTGNSASTVQNVTITQGTPQTLLTAALAYDGAVAPTGAVSFTVAGGGSVTATCTTGASPEVCTATYPTASLALGTYIITATEAADADYPGGSATATLTVEQGEVAPILDTVSNVSNVLIPAGTASATLTANIVYTGPLPTGTLTFSLPNGTAVTGTCTTGDSPLSCQATYPTASLTVGTYVITATEGADSNYAQGSATALLTVEPNASTPVSPILETGSAVNSVLIPYGQPSTTLSATIAYTGPAPKGAVTFTVVGGSGVTVPASCTSGSSPITCKAVYPTGTLGIGGYRIQLTEAADDNYPSGSAIGTLTVTNISSSAGDTVSGTGSYGAATTTVVATIPYTGTVAPSGAVTVTDGQNNTVTVPASSCSAANNNLTCTLNLPTANVVAGTDAVTVNQAADPVYAASSGAGSITIGKAAATNTDTATGTGVLGQATTPVTISIPYAGAVAPTGAVKVNDSLGNTVTVQASTCTAASNTLSCSATLPTANEPLGGNPVVVVQAADANYGGSTGSGTVTINKASAGTNDTATGTGTYGAATTPVVVTVPYSGSTVPTGAVTVSDNYKESVTVQVAQCSAANSALTCNVSMPTANEPVGANTVSVSEAADANYAGSTGTGTITLNKVPVTSTDTTTGTGTYGQATTPVTVTIPYSGTMPSTGAVTVTDTHGNTVTVPASSCTANAGVLTCTVTFPTANVPAGTDTLTVTQAADGNYLGSTGTGSLTLNKATVTTTDTASGTGVYGAATTPVTVTIPYVGSVAPTGAITLMDSYGETVTVAASTCTAAGNALTCTMNLPTVNEPVGSNNVTVTEAADSNYGGSSGGGTVTINKAAAGSDTATGTGTYGAATTQVTVTIPFTGAAPTGDITVADTLNSTVTTQASNCSAAKSVLSCTVTLPTMSEPAGANAVTVNQAADANHAASAGTGTVTLSKAAVSTGDMATGTGVVGAATTAVTVTIPYAGVAAPTGAITIADSLGNTVTVQASTCTAAKGVLSCTATLPTANEPAGANQVTVTQAGDANYSGSTGSGTVTIAKEGAGNGDTATGTGIYGAASTPATITIPYTGSTAPTGAVTLSDAHGNVVTVQAASCTVTKSNLSCTANLPTATVPAGADAVTVSQAADANTSGSTGTGTVTINKAALTTADTATGSGTYGSATTPVTVSIPYAGAAAPTGAVTVADTQGNTVTVQASSCTATKGVLTCTANLSTANVTAGTDTLTVTQAADNNYLGNTGAGSIAMSKLGATLTAPTVSPMNAPYGTSVTITETVPTGETGTVTFSNGSTVLGTAKINNGVATLTTTALPVGTASITAATSGDSNFGAATSPAVTDTVGSLATKTALVSSRATTTPGTNVTFTATVTGSGTIAGTVTFYDGTTAIGTGAVTNGVATLTTGKLAIGTHQITAAYTPVTGSLLAPSTSAAVTQTVMTVPSSVTLNSSLNPAVAQQTVTFTANVPTTMAGTIATGLVTFYDGTTVLGSVQLDGTGTAVFTTAKMTGGMHKLTAVYAGDSTYATATSATVVQAVQDYAVGNTTATVTVDPGKTATFNITVNPVTGVQFGAPVTLTVTGLPANFAASFGTVTVTPGSAGATTAMSVQTYAQKLTAALEHQQRVKSYEAALFWAAIFPLLAMGRIRRRLPKSLLMLLLCLGSLGVIAPLTGCGGGYFGPQPTSYTLTVTGTSGALQRSTTVTLNVQ